MAQTQPPQAATLVALAGGALMGIYETTSGRAYSGYPEYDALSGYPVATYSYEWYDATRDAIIRTTRTHINLGRADRVGAVDPEAFLNSPGPFPLRKKHKATEEFEAQVNALLGERPMNVHELAAALGCSFHRVKGLIRNHPDGYEILARGIWGCLYGLPGHQYAEPVYQKGMARIVAFLREFGPQTGPTICEGLNLQAETFAAARDANPGALVVTGWTDCRGASKRLIKVWAVANGQERRVEP